MLSKEFDPDAFSDILETLRRWVQLEQINKNGITK